jgi:two-component system alkaline phosphatase synthesis response regulator PhoP
MMAKSTILVVDDEEDILDLVHYNLTKEGYLVHKVTTGEDALTSTRELLPDLVLLDLMLPGLDGLEVCKILKNDATTYNIPIIMLTAKGEEADVVTGLELGADDYIAKPFSPRVLIARVRAVLRRRASDQKEDDQEVLRIHDLAIDPVKFRVLYKNKPIELTITEFRLLQFLAKRPGWVFTRYQIVDALKGEDYPVTDRSVDVQVVGLRKKLGEGGHLIETVRGVGYRFKD